MLAHLPVFQSPVVKNWQICFNLGNEIKVTYSGEGESSISVCKGIVHRNSPWEFKEHI